MLDFEEVLSEYAEDGDELGLCDEASVDWSKGGQSEKKSGRGDGEVDGDEGTTSERERKPEVLSVEGEPDPARRHELLERFG